MTDLAKGRYFGFAPYVKYRELCAGQPYKTFDDLEDVMSKEVNIYSVFLSQMSVGIISNILDVETV